MRTRVQNALHAIVLAHGVRLSNRRGMPHATFNRELLHQPQKPTIEPVASIPTTTGGGIEA